MGKEVETETKEEGRGNLGEATAAAGGCRRQWRRRKKATSVHWSSKRVRSRDERERAMQKVKRRGVHSSLLTD